MDFIKDAKTQIATMILTALNKAVSTGELKEVCIPNFIVEIPADTSHGDFASNVAMICAKPFGLAPIKIAQIILEHLSFTDTHFSGAKVAGPGFMNFTLCNTWFAQVIQGILQSGTDYGRSDFGKGEKVMVEFVSANPTGPMHMGNARGGSTGDCLASVLSMAGFDVTREFLINDAGNQINKLANSLDARYQQIFSGENAVVFPEDGYQGEDIKERAQELNAEFGNTLLALSPEERKEKMVAFILPKNIAKLKSDLEKYRIVYDVWFSEQTLHADGSVKKAIDTLLQNGKAYEKEGVIWYKATDYGAEKDEVLVRGNGIPTYFAADIAYHYNKFHIRKFSRVINVWGADHHGHVARLKGAMDAIGLDGSKLDIVLIQLVKLIQDGQPVKMSKRTGKSITLSDLIEEVPIDAARFFFNMREPNSQLDFDLDLATQQSSLNPVYYVQYAHARICSILRKLEEQGFAYTNVTQEALLLLRAPEELELIRTLSLLPSLIVECAKNQDPAKITTYSIEVATKFHKFYNACHIANCEDTDLKKARISLCLSVKGVIFNILTMLKITIPETM